MKNFYRVFRLLIVLSIALPILHNNVLSQEISDEVCEILRQTRRKQLSDPYRPCWHLTIPEGHANPFDPNAAICKDGICHLWYIYQNTDKRTNRWAHVSTRDLFHWRWHSFELQPEADTPERGINSGNAFYTHDGRVAISYQGVGAGGGNGAGNCLAFSSDPNLDTWVRSPNNPNVVPCADTHMWFENGQYYLISGGFSTSLFKGDSCDGPMTKVGPFMSRNMPDVEKDEDISCPDFFKLGDKWVLLGITHLKGGRYYIGTWDGNQFTPETHHRMNWPGGNYFAPESLVDDSGRRICWSWLRNDGSDESVEYVTVMSMPRVLTLAADGKSLNYNPPREIESLRVRPESCGPMQIKAGEDKCLTNIKGNSLELDVLIDPLSAKRFGIKVFCSEDGQEETPVIIDLEKKTATIDFKRSGLKSVKYHKYFCFNNFVKRDPNPEVTEQTAPISGEIGKKVRIRAYLDKSILEVFINENQCLSQIIYPTSPDSQRVSIFAEDSDISVESVHAWELFPANPW